jgi:WD40 repeat protein
MYDAVIGGAMTTRRRGSISPGAYKLQEDVMDQVDRSGSLSSDLPRGERASSHEAGGDAAAPVVGPSARFGRSLAVVVGIDRYEHGLAPLRSAVADARAVADALRRDHAFESWCMFDDDAQPARLLALLHDELPAALGPEDRLVFYFAGHGIALDSDAGPAGYLILAGARRADRHGFLAMRTVHDALMKLSAHHVLVILDCCFAGTFRWAHLRDVSSASDSEARIYRERYERYVERPAWQVLTSASSDQRAFDLLVNDRDEGTGTHSPFALALLAGLAGAADYTRDNLITADELAIYVRAQVAPAAESAGARQVPQLFELERHDGGQFVFQVPDRALALASAPQLDEAANPYRGLAAFREQDHAVFFGRSELIERLVAAVSARRLTVVVGPSGSGKSSLVHAGLVPALRRDRWTVLPTERPGREPLAALHSLVRALDGEPNPVDPGAVWLAAVAEQDRRHGDRPWLIIIDQLEELLTYRSAERDRDRFLEALESALRAAPSLHVVVTVRADVEPVFRDTALAPWWADAGFAMVAMTRDELRQVIERPATAAVLYFEPARLVDQLLDDVALTPAPLPLLSFALSELYRRCWMRWQRGVRDRALHAADYAEIGSVARALTQRATACHDQLVAEDPAYAMTIRNVFTRMVSLVGGEPTRRRVPRSELAYDDPAENLRVAEVLQRYHDARLISLGRDQRGGGTASAYAEPTHDELVRGWTNVSQWLDELDDRVGLRTLASLGDAVRSWQDHSHSDAYLWADPRLGPLRETARTGLILLNTDETRFVEYSVRAQTRAIRQRRRATRIVVAAIAVFAVVASILAVIARGNANEALAQRNTALANQLVAEAASIQVAQPGLARQLIAAARDVKLTPQVAAALATSHAIAQELHVDAGLLAFSGDGRLLAVAGGAHDSGLNAPKAPPIEAHVQLYDADTLAVVFEQQLGLVPIYALAFSPSQAHLLAIGRGHDIIVWDVGNPRAPIARTLSGHTSNVVAVSFRSDGRLLASLSRDGELRLWDVSSPTPSAALSATTLGIDGVARCTLQFQPGSDVIAVVATAMSTKLPSGLSEEVAAEISEIIDGHHSEFLVVNVGEVSHPVLGHPAIPDVSQFAFAPDGRHIVTASKAGLQQWRAEHDGQLSAPLSLPLRTAELEIARLGYSSRDQVAALTRDGRVLLWDVSVPDHPSLSGELAMPPPDVSESPSALLGTPLRDSHAIGALSFAPDGMRLAALSPGSNVGTKGVGVNASTVRIWNVAAPGERGAVAAIRGALSTVSPDGQRLAMLRNGRIHLLNLADPQHPRQDGELSMIDNVGVIKLAFSQDGEALAAAFHDGDSVMALDVSHPQRPFPVAFWKLRTRPDGCTPGIPCAALVTALAFLDGHTVAAGELFAQIMLFDIARFDVDRGGDNPPLEQILPAATPVALHVVSRNGRRLLVVALAGIRIEVWDVSHPGHSQMLSQMPTSGYQIEDLAMSRDGELLVSGDRDGSVTVWSLRDGQLSPNAYLHDTGEVYSVALGPGGRVMATFGRDHVIRVYDIQRTPPSLALAIDSGASAISRIMFLGNDHTLGAQVGDELDVWELDPDVNVGELCIGIGERMTAEQWQREIPGIPYKPRC